MKRRFIFYLVTVYILFILLFSFGHVNDSCFSLGLRSNETKRAFATLRALVEVMESLSKDTGPDGVGQLITEEVSIFLSSVWYLLCMCSYILYQPIGC